MNKQQIIQALQDDLTVLYKNLSYKVVQTKDGRYLIQHVSGHCMGLIDSQGNLTEKEEFFSIHTN